MFGGHKHDIHSLKWQPKDTWKSRLKKNRNYGHFRGDCSQKKQRRGLEKKGSLRKDRASK